jgi:uncharacterized protein YceK
MKKAMMILVAGAITAMMVLAGCGATACNYHEGDYGETYGLDAWVVDENLWGTEDGNLWGYDTEGFEEGTTYVMILADNDTPLDQTDDVVFGVYEE